MKLSSRVWKYCSTSAELARHACCNIFTQVRIISLSNFQSHDNSIIFLNETLISILCLESRYKYSLKTIAFINRSHSSLEEHYSLDEYYSTIPAIRVRVRALPKKENFFFINWGLTLYVVHNKDWQVKGPYHVQVPKHRIICVPRTGSETSYSIEF